MCVFIEIDQTVNGPRSYGSTVLADIHPFIHTFTRAFTHSPVHSPVHPFHSHIHPFIHTFTRSIHTFTCRRRSRPRRATAKSD